MTRGLGHQLDLMREDIRKHRALDQALGTAEEQLGDHLCPHGSDGQGQVSFDTFVAIVTGATMALPRPVRTEVALWHRMSIEMSSRQISLIGGLPGEIVEIIDSHGSLVEEGYKVPVNRVREADIAGTIIEWFGKSNENSKQRIEHLMPLALQQGMCVTIGTLPGGKSYIMPGVLEDEKKIA